MHVLSIEETQQVTGSNFSDVGYVIFGVGGTYYGIGLGASVAVIPAIFIALGLACCGVDPVVSVSAAVGTIGIGAVGGGYLGGKFGTAMGTVVGQAADEA